jgi:hypothetical protein
MRVSHETIYPSLYVQRRGALRGELRRCLRTGRAMRHPRGDRPAGVASSHAPADLLPLDCGQRSGCALGWVLLHATALQHKGSYRGAALAHPAGDQPQ